MRAALKEAQTEGQREKTGGWDPIQDVFETSPCQGNHRCTHTMDVVSSETENGKGKCFLPKE